MAPPFESSASAVEDFDKSTPASWCTVVVSMSGSSEVVPAPRSKAHMTTPATPFPFVTGPDHVAVVAAAGPVRTRVAELLCGAEPDTDARTDIMRLTEQGVAGARLPLRRVVALAPNGTGVHRRRPPGDLGVGAAPDLVKLVGRGACRRFAVAPTGSATLCEVTDVERLGGGGLGGRGRT